jgi:hypothetical protein
MTHWSCVVVQLARQPSSVHLPAHVTFVASQSLVQVVTVVVVVVVVVVPPPVVPAPELPASFAGPQLDTHLS